MCPVETITRCRGRVTQFVGFDVTEDEAREALAAGDAEAGPTLEAPAALYLRVPLSIGEFVHPAGAMLHVGAEINEAQALGLLRNCTSLPARMAGVPQPADPIVSVPGGGIG